MVRYLGINYLNEAVASRRQLLSRCLLTVPHHQEHQDRETLIDDRYRLPWKKVKADKELLKTEAVKVASAADDLVQLSEVSTEQVENFSYDHYDGNDCYVLPSSNPDSPDFFPLDDTSPTLVKDQTTPDAIKEYFEQEDLKQYQTGNDELRLDLLSQEDYLSDTLKKVPSISTLRARFRPVQVKDPLAQDKNFGTADLRFSEDAFVPMLEQTYNGDLFKESFKGQIPELQNNIKGELENVITPPCSQTMAGGTEEAARLSKTVISLEEMPIETEASVAEIVETSLCVLQRKIKPEGLCGSPVVSERPTFLDINEIIITEEDKFCEKAFLPVPADDSIEEDLKIPKLHMPEVENIAIADKEANICLLTEREKHILIEKTFARERFCDEIQASRLPEPALDIEEAFSKDESFRETPVNKAKDVVDFTPCTDIGQTELALPWSIIKLGSEVKDSSKMLNMLTVEGECGITVKPVETVEMYSKEDIYDWKDPMISLKGPPSPKKAIGMKQIENEKPTKPQAFTDKVLAVPKAAINLPSVGNDPLDDFMALRMKMSSASSKQPAVTAETEKFNQEPYPLPEVNIQPSSVKEPKLAQQGRARTKHHIVSVKLSDDFRHVLELLSDKASYMIQALKISGDVSQSCCFETLTPDMTRFLLKQKEKQIQDGNSEFDEIYRNIVGLHALSGAADIIANCCLESGIAHISAVQEKYSTTLKGYLTDVRQRLFEMKALFTKRQVYHPKIMAVCKEVETWLKKKRAKSRDSEQKILLLVKRDLPSLLKSLKTILSLGQLLIPEIITSASTEDIIRSLDQHNCLLAYSGLVDDNFPWAQFCLVVEYESQSASVWKDHCERQNIRHIAFTLDTGDQQEASTDISWTTTNPSQQITLIASQNITKNIELLQILEARHNIMLVERDYSLIEGCRQLHFPDVDVDEGCGIVLAPLVDLKDDCMVQALVTKLLALSLKLASCWVLLYSDKPNCYEFPGVVVTSLSRLVAAIANMTFKKEQWDVKVLTCSDLSEVAGCIRSISEHCMTASTDRDSQDWLARDWLSEEISQGEKFLLMMPPITSFTAQLMLKFFSLRELMNSDLQELKAVLPYVPQKVFMVLLTVANKVNGLHLEDNRPGAESENLEETSVSIDDDTEEESGSLSPVRPDDSKEKTITSPNDVDKTSKSDIESGGDNPKPSEQDKDQGGLINRDYNSTGYTMLDNEESRMSEDGDHSYDENNASFQVEVNDRMTVDRNAGDMQQFNRNRTAPTERKSEATAMSKSNAHREQEDWVALENFMKAKRHAAVRENSKDSLQSCRNYDHNNVKDKLSDNSLNTRAITDNLPKERKIGQTVNEIKDFVPKTAEQDVGYRINKPQIEEHADIQSFMMKYQRNELSKTDLNIMYPENKNRQGNSYEDIAHHHVRRNLNETYDAEHESDNHSRNNMDDSKYSNAISRYSEDEIETCVNEDLNKSKPSNDMNQENMEGFSQSEIDRCLKEDLENYVNNRFSNPKRMTTGRSDPKGQQSFTANDNDEVSGNRPVKVDYGKKMFERMLDEKKLDSRFDQRIIDETKLDSRFDQRLIDETKLDSKVDQRSDTRTVSLKDSILPSLSSKIVRKTNPAYDRHLDEQLYTCSDGVIRASDAQLINITKKARFSERKPENRSRYFYNEDDILLHNSRQQRENEDELTFQQLFRKAFTEMKQQSDNFVFRPVLDQLDQDDKQSDNFVFRPVLDEFDKSRNEQSRLRGNDRWPERNYSSVERNDSDLTYLGTSADTFYSSVTSNNTQRKPRFDLEPISETSIVDERRLERQTDTNVTKDIKATEGNRQPQPNSKQAISEFIDNPGRFYVNPNIERLSQRPKLKNPPPKPHTEVPNEGRSLADDLRETTRKVLANSEQFSRLSSTSSRRPMQKLNIGLAVPLHRDQRSRNSSGHYLSSGGPSQRQNVQEQSDTNQTLPRTELISLANTESMSRREVETSHARNRAQDMDAMQPQRLAYENRRDSDATDGQRSDFEIRQRSQQRTLQEQKALMMQSPWTAGDSPPMDLDYDEELTQRDTFSANRAVFTHQTPLKKRKLTYQAVPGKKGQTRLVFQ